uniref:MyoD family inhibitor domain containing n=1 Tax=Cyprinus carpio TaxID=7962 RepID=A0A8C1W3Q7_CYPCA
MSSETILPPEGPEGPKKQLQEETNPLLSKSTDKCNSCTDVSSDATEKSQTPIPGDATSNGQDHMTEVHTHDDLVRTQPQPLPQPSTSLQHGIDGEAARQQNGLHAVLGNGHGTPCGVTQPPSTGPTSESRKHPSPVSHRVQRKLRSSLSVNSDSSKRSKSSSTGSHKPGSTPEGGADRAQGNSVENLYMAKYGEKTGNGLSLQYRGSHMGERCQNDSFLQSAGITPIHWSARQILSLQTTLGPGLLRF